jgi:hypothetical protein
MSKKICLVSLFTVIELLLFISGSNTAAASTQLTVSPTSVNFGTVNVGSSAQHSIKITNSSQTFLAIRSVSVNGSYFAIAGIATPLPMRAGASFSFTAKFTPSAAGSQTGKVAIVTSSGETVDVTLSGNTPANTVSIVPTSASFGNVPLGSANSQTFTVTNHGSTTVSVLSKSISGTGLSISGLASGLQIGSGQSSTFNVAFKPAQTGAITASATVDFSASGKTIGLTVPVSGNGVAATSTLEASPSALSFGDVTVGKSSSLPLKVTNAGNSSVTITRSAVTGSGFSVSGLSALTLQPGQSDSVPVIFAPTSTGSVSGNISIATSSATASVALSGSGIVASSTHTVSLSWVASTSTGMAGYYVERGTISGGPYQVLNSSPETGTSYVDSTVQDGKEYFYVVVSVSAGGQESKPSGQVSATIPSS